MNSSPTPSFPTPSRRSEAALAVLLLCGCGLAHAHGEADDALPPEPGVRLSAAAAVTWLDSNKELPSQRLRGFLLQGDSGTDRQSLALEHATVGAAWRINDMLGAELTVGKHGSDTAHVESAWVQARHDADGADHWWLLTAGRQRPALGGTLGQGGHFDRFALMPLAKQMATHGDWMDDGLQLGWRQDTGQRRLSADVGLWAGRVFPGGDSGPVVPTVHLGWGQGPWQVDGFAGWLKPERRGSSVSSNAGHSHTAPECNATLKDVACFTGRSTLAGASVVWAGAQSPVALPLMLSASGWLRDEKGSLESANGLGQYRAQNRGLWLQALWDVAPRWQTGVRLERAWTTQSLSGPGASLLATETGLSAYQPASRQTVLLAWQPSERITLSAELGRERAAAAQGVGSSTVNFAALRLVARTDWLSGGE
ncbi:MAG: hypothetical protein Q8S32_03585 [Burkholderiaceae bacterium]|nr:hypothetical protein [Burkholderiaceae bacterium]